ncbi:hypothetical protein [Methylobacterium tarhaniae]|uniref:hypothetical protein n=1 Tax=Methylobacterium tarhaniae TaxID=1187852 RepID=UPI003D05480D
MIRSRHILVGAALALALVAGPAGARQYKNSGATTESPGVVPEVNDRAVGADNPMPVTVGGAVQPPTAAAGKIIDTSVVLTANTSTTLVAARATSGDRLAIEIQCDGAGAVGIDMKGGALTSATAAPRVIPSGSFPLYTPPIASQTAITAYTGTPQTCRVTEYLR